MNNNYKYEKVAGLYNIGKVIGKGHYAVVKEASHVLTNEKVAIKIIDKRKLDQTLKDHLLLEVMCMKLVQHPNIIRLYEVIDTVNKLYLILELGDGGDLYDFIINKESNGLCEDEAKRYFRQILRAISYCHKLHVVHRDIKPENIVFFKELELVKLTDFGFSNKFVPGGTLSTSCGSFAYSAPEILLGDSYDAPKVDIWSLGVILYMLVVGYLPFNESNDNETIAKIMDCQYSIPSYVSTDCRNLIKKMIVRDPSKRITLDNIIDDVWLKINDFNYELENYNIPLISQEQLTFEEHIEILTKMSDENLGSIDEIQQILDNNEYSHLSTTYYLLAERKLKRRFVDEYVKLKTIKEIVNDNKESCNVIEKSNVINQSSLNVMKRISIILEDEENEENEAITSLVFVRNELEKILSPNEKSTINVGVTALNLSRCVSRITSSIDIHSLLNENENEPNNIIVKPRIRVRQSIYRSNSPVISQHSTALSLKSEGVCDKNGKYIIRYPIIINNNMNTKKSLSFNDLSEHCKINTPFTNLKNSVHKFSFGSKTPTNLCINTKCMDLQKSTINERRPHQVFFDTSSNSSTANCSSTDNSDVENETKVKIKTVDKLIGQQKCELNNKTKTFTFDTYRSQSFDGQFRNNIQNNDVSLRDVLSKKCKYKSAYNSWHRNSLCSYLEDSNFSLISLANKIDNPNVMQVIRGAIALNLHNRQNSMDTTLPPALDSKNTNISHSVLQNYSKEELSLKTERIIRNFYKQLRSAIPRFKKRKFYTFQPKITSLKLSQSTSCGMCSEENNNVRISNLNHKSYDSINQETSPSKHSGHKSTKINNLFKKKHKAACCILF